MGVGYDHDAGRADSGVYREDREAADAIGQGSDRRHRERARFVVAAELDGNRQPHFKKQPTDQTVVWFYALFTDRPGDYVKKPMRDCTGEEITREWLYHLGVP